MSDFHIGVIACASMHNQIKKITSSMDGKFKIYPIVPPCTFNLKVELIRYYIDKSIEDNQITLLAYGLCHPLIKTMLSEYDDSVVRLKGSNCYEMFLGKKKYISFHDKAYWILNKPFFTRFKNDLLSGYELNTNNGRMLMKETYKKLLYLDFEEDPLERPIIEKFAKEVHLEYEIYPTDLKYLTTRLCEAITLAKPSKSKRISSTLEKAPNLQEIKIILEEIDEMIYKMDIHSRNFIYVSPQVESLIGYSPNEFIKILNEKSSISLYHKEDRNYVLGSRYKFIIQCLEKSIAELFRIEYRMIHKKGHRIWVEEKLYPVFNNEGNIYAFVGKICPITERKKAEQKLKASLKKTKFYKDLLSHDMANILNNIKSSARLLKMWKDDPKKSEKRDNMLEIITQQIERGTSLILNVRRLSEVGEGLKSTISLDVIDILTEAITNISSRFQEREMKIITNFPEETIYVNGSKLLLDAFENILINGILHNESERKRLWINTSTIQENGNKYFKVEFKDNGVGISNGRKKAIFDQKSKSYENKGGMGIGLSLVKKIINGYGGKIRVENRINGDFTQGTNFIILLEYA